MPWVAAKSRRLASFRRGDSELLDQVYRIYEPPLRLFLQTSSATHRLLSVVDLDDLVQETFARAFAYDTRLRYDGSRPFAYYLRAIAKNLALDLHRSRRRETAALQRQQRNCFVTNTWSVETPEVALIQRKMGEIYGTFLGSLRPEERLLVTLRVNDEMSRRAVSQATGYSPAQVRTKEQHLLGRLYRRLKQAGLFENARF